MENQKRKKDVSLESKNPVELFRLKIFYEFMKMKDDMWMLVEPVLRDCGLNISQVVILLLVDMEKEQTIGSLREQMNFNQGNTSSLCKKMEMQGLVKRERKAGDERVVLIKITREGRQMLNRLAEGFSRYDSVTKKIPQKKILSILKGMKDLKDVLNMIWEDAQMES